MPHMAPNVQIPPSARFVDLCYVVAVHVVIQRVQISEILRRPPFTTMMQRVHANVIVLDQPVLELLG